MSWQPKIEINIKLNSGAVDRWGLTTADHCVVVLRYGDFGECTQKRPEDPAEGWYPWKNSYVPTAVAAQMSALALQDIARDEAAMAAVAYSR